MKLQEKDVLDLLENDDDEVSAHARDIEESSNVLTNRVRKIRNAVAMKQEDHQVYANRDKTRMKR